MFCEQERARGGGRAVKEVAEGLWPAFHDCGANGTIGRDKIRVCGCLQERVGKIKTAVQSHGAGTTSVASSEIVFK